MRMRSELINEIFSVETEAEKIVSDAQQRGRAVVAAAQEEGEKRLHSALDGAPFRKGCRDRSGPEEC